MKPKESRNEKLADKMIKSLEKRHFNAFFCKTSDDAVKKVLDIIPRGSSVTWGGSMTIRDMGLTKALHDNNYMVYDRDEAATREDAAKVYLKAFECDYYLSSANAISQDGVIVNIDGNGNRVAAITWGPKNVIFVIGMNKVTQDVTAAMARARGTASPINAARFDIDTPCTKDGTCHNCNSMQCICNYIHIMRNSHPAKRHTVILVDEDLGY